MSRRLDELTWPSTPQEMEQALQLEGMMKRDGGFCEMDDITGVVFLNPYAEATERTPHGA